MKCHCDCLSILAVSVVTFDEMEGNWLDIYETNHNDRKITKVKMEIKLTMVHLYVFIQSQLLLLKHMSWITLRKKIYIEIWHKLSTGQQVISLDVH